MIFRADQPFPALFFCYFLFQQLGTLWHLGTLCWYSRSSLCNLWRHFYLDWCKLVVWHSSFFSNSLPKMLLINNGVLMNKESDKAINLWYTYLLLVQLSLFSFLKNRSQKIWVGIMLSWLMRFFMFGRLLFLFSFIGRSLKLFLVFRYEELTCPCLIIEWFHSSNVQTPEMCPFTKLKIHHLILAQLGNLAILWKNRPSQMPLSIQQ